MTEQPPADIPTEPDRLLREKKNAVHLWRILLDCLDCGDCIEDFQRQPGIQFKISHLTTILTTWLKEAEDNVEYHGKSDMERLKLMLESDLNE